MELYISRGKQTGARRPLQCNVCCEGGNTGWFVEGFGLYPVGLMLKNKYSIIFQGL